MTTNRTALPAWVKRGEKVQVVHYDAAGAHVHTLNTKITAVDDSEIVLAFALTKRFTRSMYLPASDQFERSGEGLNPHRYVLRRSTPDDRP